MANSESFSYQQIDLPTNSNRINWIDHAKGIGIFLVVLGHTLRGLVGSSILEPSMQEQMIDKWIYAFHMPLFFFISGLFIERSVSRQTFNNFFIGKIQTIVYPYFVWSILQEIIRRLTVTNSESRESLWRILYDPVLQFWFLYVLFIISTGYAVFRKLKLSINSFIFVCFLLYAAHLLEVNFGSWGVIYMLRMNAIYFAIGIFATKLKALNRLSELSSFCLFGSAISGFLLIALSVSLKLSTIDIFVPLLACIGIFSSLSLASFLQRSNLANFLNQWGLLSLEIFVAHTIFSAGIRIFLQKLLHLSNPTIHIVMGVLVGVYGPIWLYMICKKFKLHYVFSLRSVYTAKN